MLLIETLPASQISQTLWMTVPGKKRRRLHADSRHTGLAQSHLCFAVEAVRQERQPVANGLEELKRPSQQADYTFDRKRTDASSIDSTKTADTAQLFPMRPQSSKDSLMKAVSERNWKEAYQEYGRLPDTEKEHLEAWGLHNDLLTVIARSRSIKPTVELYNKLHATKLSYTSLANVLATCIKAEDLVRAIEVFRDMQTRDMKPNITTWCYLINSLSKSSRRKGWPYAKNAFILWKELEAAQHIDADIDASYYATGIMACTRHGAMEEAENLLEAMQEEGAIDVRAFNMLIKGYASKGDLAAMGRVMGRMQELKIRPIVSTYNTLIDAYSSKQMMAEARNVVELASKDGMQLDTWSFSSLIKGYVKSGDMTQVGFVLDAMKQADVLPNVVTLTNLLDGCVSAGLMSEAEELMQSMRDARIQPNILSYNSLLRGYAAKGEPFAVKRVLLRMGEEGLSPREDTYNTLMTAALSSGNANLVPELFTQLVETSLRPNSLSYTALITAFARMQNSSGAKQAFRKLKDDVGMDRIALNALVSALANANRMEEAESQLGRAADLAQKQGLPPPVEAYGAVVKAYTRRRDAEAAMDCFYEFQDRGGEPDDGLLDSVVTACVRAGEYKRALQFVRSMERAGKDMDRARLKQTLEVVMKLQEQSLRQKKKLQRNQNLERFKFWLGLPNNYYDDDDEE